MLLVLPSDTELSRLPHQSRTFYDAVYFWGRPFSASTIKNKIKRRGKKERHPGPASHRNVYFQMALRLFFF